MTKRNRRWRLQGIDRLKNERARIAAAETGVRSNLCLEGFKCVHLLVNPMQQILKFGV